MNCQIFKLVFIVSIVGLSSAAEWSYEGDSGPQYWANSYPDCGESVQSPINIKHSETKEDASLKAFSHSLFQTLPVSMKISNTGHSLQVDLEGGYTLNDRNLLPADYKATQFHVHWAKQGSDTGSEHTLDGKRYFAEMHVVHYNTTYPSFNDAMDKDSGLAVLGFFITADAAEDNLEFNRLLDPISNITYDDQNQIYTTRFSLDVLLPPNLGDYYRYKGSLTTPPCSESVVWTVFSDPIRISSAQKLLLQTGLYEEAMGANSTTLIGDNFRPIQPLNSRSITRPMGCGAAMALPSLISVMVMGLLAMMNLM